MNDLISRQAAIDALYNVDEYNGRSVEAIRNLPSEQPEQRWIPCSERLPEKDGLYLVTTSKGKVQSHVFSHNGNSEYWMRFNKAWMPLPEPYKGGEQDE